MQEIEISLQEIEQLLKDNPNLEIETPDGWVKVNKFFNQGIKQTYKVTFKNGLQVISTLDHKYQTNLGMIPLGKIREQHNVLTKKGYTQIKSIVEDSLQNTYDIEVNHSNHRFYADDVVVSNSQGMTISDNLVLNCERIFAHGQFYVAISRCGDPKKLYINGLKPEKHIRANPLSKRFYKLAKESGRLEKWYGY